MGLIYGGAAHNYNPTQFKVGSVVGSILNSGVGDGIYRRRRRGRQVGIFRAPFPKNREKYRLFLANIMNNSDIVLIFIHIFLGRNVFPTKLSELLRLCAVFRCVRQPSFGHILNTGIGYRICLKCRKTPVIESRSFSARVDCTTENVKSVRRLH